MLILLSTLTNTFAFFNFVMCISVVNEFVPSIGHNGIGEVKTEYWYSKLV